MVCEHGVVGRTAQPCSNRKAVIGAVSGEGERRRRERVGLGIKKTAGKPRWEPDYPTTKARRWRQKPCPRQQFALQQAQERRRRVKRRRIIHVVAKKMAPHEAIEGCGVASTGRSKDVRGEGISGGFDPNARIGRSGRQSRGSMASEC